MGNYFEAMTKLGVQRKLNNERYPCKIAGCKYTSHKGSLCKKHYEMVPWEMRRAVMIEVADAGYRIGQKHHARQLAFVRKTLRAVARRSPAVTR